MGRALPFTVVGQKTEYASKGKEVILTVGMVKKFRDKCVPGMELLGEQVRLEGFGSMAKVLFGHEERKIIKMRIVKKYSHVALMNDGGCQRWEDLALLNMNLVQ